MILAPVLPPQRCAVLVVSQRADGTAFASSLRSKLPQDCTVSLAADWRRLPPGTRPNVVVLFYGKDVADAARWTRVRDGFVPGVESAVTAMRALPGAPKVLLMLPKDRPTEPRNAAVLESGVIPLLRQAARESGAAVIGTSSDPRDALDDVAEAATELHEDKSSWKLLSADSEQADEGPAKNAIDGDPSTYWHTQYDPKTPGYPHSLEVDLGSTQRISGFTYLPRQDGGMNGRVKGYEFYVSQDGQTWQGPVVKGDLPNVLGRSRIRLAEPVSARYFRFVATSEVHGGPWASAAEVGILKDAD